MQSWSPQSIVASEHLAEAGAAHAKRMVSFAERMRNQVLPFTGRQWRTWNLKQREILVATLQQHLVAEPRNDRQPEHLGVKSLGALQLRNFDSKMVEPIEFHHAHPLSL